MLCKLGVIIFRFQTPPSWFSKSKTPQQWKYWVNKDLFDCFLCSRWCWFGGQTWPMDPRKQLLSLSTSLVHQPLACSATTTTTKKTQENDNCLEHNLTTVAFAIILHFQYICWNSILTWKVALLWSFCFLFQIQSKEWTNSGDSSFPSFPCSALQIVSFLIFFIHINFLGVTAPVVAEPWVPGIILYQPIIVPHVHCTLKSIENNLTDWDKFCRWSYIAPERFSWEKNTLLILLLNSTLSNAKSDVSLPS